MVRAISQEFLRSPCRFFNARNLPLRSARMLTSLINVEICIFVNNCFNRDSFSIFNENFKLVSTTHSYNTRSAKNGPLFVPSSYNTVRFGRKSIIHSTTLTWNYLQDKLTEYNFLYLTNTKKPQNIVSKIFHF